MENLVDKVSLQMDYLRYEHADLLDKIDKKIHKLREQLNDGSFSDTDCPLENFDWSNYENNMDECLRELEEFDECVDECLEKYKSKRDETIEILSAHFSDHEIERGDSDEIVVKMHTPDYVTVKFEIEDDTDMLYKTCARSSSCHSRGYYYNEIINVDFEKELIDIDGAIDEINHYYSK